jgi:hypothetical protein
LKAPLTTTPSISSFRIPWRYAFAYKFNPFPSALIRLHVVAIKIFKAKILCVFLMVV